MSPPAKTDWAFGVKEGRIDIGQLVAGRRSIPGAPLPYFDLFAPKSIDEKSSDLFLSHFGAF